MFNPYLLWLLVAVTSIVHATPLEAKSSETLHIHTKHSFDVLKYRLEINLVQCFQAPYPKTFNASEIITFKSDSALREIKLDANAQSLTIDSVRMAGISWSHQNNSLNIILDRIYKRGEVVNVRIYYSYKNDEDNGLFVSAGYVYTDSPPEGTRNWLPSRDRPSDKATWEVFAKVPISVRLGSTGTLADSTISGDAIIYHWISNNPVSTYLICFTSSINFEVHTMYWHKLAHPADSIPIRIYYKPAEDLSVFDSIIVPLTNFYSEIFGDYPFEKIGFATLDNSFQWGGMENQTMVNLMPGGYSDANLIAHEHSHQWFGDLITCGSWADIWLNEGFGTYCQNLWVEHVSGADAYLKSMKSLAGYYIAHNPGWPIYHAEWADETPSSHTLYNQAITYNKGACVLFQLRYVLGDSTFFRVMHAYATDTNLIFKNAFTEDFIQITNRVSGKNMDWFFDQWVYKPNHPVYQNTYEIINPGKNAWEVTIDITQTQGDPGFFKMPVQLQINFDDGTDTVVMVMHTENHQKFKFPFRKQPKEVVFDPFSNILLKQATTINTGKQK